MGPDSNLIRFWPVLASISALKAIQRLSCSRQMPRHQPMQTIGRYIPLMSYEVGHPVATILYFLTGKSLMMGVSHMCFAQTLAFNLQSLWNLKMRWKPKPKRQLKPLHVIVQKRTCTMTPICHFTLP